MHITYDLQDGDINTFELSDYIGTTAKEKQPTWYKELTLFMNKCRNKEEFVSNFFNIFMQHGSQHSYKTAKGCPAFINFFRQSLALKTASDIFIGIEAFGDSYSYNWTTRDSFWNIEEHNVDQVGSLGKRCIALKFSGAFSWISDTDCQFQYVDPYMHNDIPYRVCPGNVYRKKGNIGHINMPVLFPKQSGEYYIKQGTILGYLHFDKPLRSIKRGDLSEHTNKYKHQVYTKDNLKDMIGKK